MRKTLLITALTVTLTGLAAATARATFPGRNGPIAFRAGALPVPPGVPWPLFVARADGTHEQELSSQLGLFTDWRADGRRLAFDFFQPNGDEQIATSQPNGGDMRTITAGPGIHEVPSYSPDGQRIAFDYSPQSDPNAPGFETHLWTMRADGRDAAPLPMENPGFDVEPRYAPNGHWIAFGRIRLSSDNVQQQAVFIVGAHGGQARKLTPWSQAAEHPTWSPDSRWITYDLPVGTIDEIHPDGRGHRTILAAANGWGFHKPSFSPDGKLILFMCAFNGPGHGDDLCTTKIDGIGLHDITPNTPQLTTDMPQRGVNGPSWGPAPEHQARRKR